MNEPCSIASCRIPGTFTGLTWVQPSWRNGQVTLSTYCCPVYCWLVVTGCHGFCIFPLGMSSSQLTNSNLFQRGGVPNHQPVIAWWLVSLTQQLITSVLSWFTRRASHRTRAHVGCTSEQRYVGWQLAPKNALVKLVEMQPVIKRGNEIHHQMIFPARPCWLYDIHIPIAGWLNITQVLAGGAPPCRQSCFSFDLLKGGCVFKMPTHSRVLWIVREMRSELYKLSVRLGNRSSLPLGCCSLHKGKLQWPFIIVRAIQS